MALLVDPPHRDSADEPPPGEVSSMDPDETAAALASPVMTEQQPRPPATSEPGEHRLAEPPLTGGRVEALMGQLIRVLSHSPLARPLPAVILTALGLGGVAFVGLCATAPVASVA